MTSTYHIGDEVPFILDGMRVEGCVEDYVTRHDDVGSYRDYRVDYEGASYWISGRGASLVDQDYVLTMQPRAETECQFDPNQLVFEFNDCTSYVMGLEITFLPISSFSPDSITHIIRDWAASQGISANHVRFIRGGSDPGCMEFTSPPSTDIDFMLRFYRKLRETIHTSTGVTPKPSIRDGEEPETSGGGHIHISRKESFEVHSDDLLIHNACAELANHPYILWTFLDPADTYIKNTCTLFHRLNEEIRERLRAYPWAGREHELIPDVLTGYHCEDKNYGIRWRSDLETLELRFFEAPMNENEQKLHILFANAWLRHIDTSIKIEARNRTFEVSQDWTKPKAKRAMRKYLKTLGLAPEDYEEILERNLTERFASDLGYRLV